MAGHISRALPPSSPPSSILPPPRLFPVSSSVLVSGSLVPAQTTTPAMEGTPVLDIDSGHTHPSTPAGSSMAYAPSASSSSMQNGHGLEHSPSGAGGHNSSSTQQKCSSGPCVLGPRALAVFLPQRLNDALVDIYALVSRLSVQK